MADFLSPHHSYLSCGDSQMLGEKDTLHPQGSIDQSYAPHPEKSKHEGCQDQPGD